MAVIESLSHLIPNTSDALMSLLVLLLSTWYFRSRRNHPPGPWANHLFGHIVDIQRSADYYITLQGYRRKYGDIFRLRFGLHPVIVLNNSKLIREALVEKAELFSNRPDYLLLTNIIVQNKGIMFNLHDWPFTRKFAMTAMRDFAAGKSPMEEKCLEEIDVLTEEFLKHKSKPFECQLLMANAVSNIISGVVFNRRFDYDNEKFREVIGFMYSLFRVNPQYTAVNVIPGLLKVSMLLNSSMASRIETDMNVMRGFVHEMIEQHQTTFDPENIRDITDLYLHSQQENSKERPRVSEEDAFWMIMDLFLAGTETTNTTLQWFFIYMMYNPEVQERCRKEIQEVIGSERNPSMNDRSKMVYTEATLLEIQRIVTMVPLSVPHMSSRDTTLGGYTVPKGAWVIPNIYSCHHDHDAWGDPDNFRPGRWIDEQGALRKHQAFMPFSVGKRACPGESLAQMEIFLFAVALLQRFRFKFADTKPDIRGHHGATMLAKPFVMIAEPFV